MLDKQRRQSVGVNKTKVVLVARRVCLSPSPHLPISPSPHLPISPSPHLPISPSPHLPISPSPHLPISPSPHLPISLARRFLPLINAIGENKPATTDVEMSSDYDDELQQVLLSSASSPPPFSLSFRFISWPVLILCRLWRCQ